MSSEGSPAAASSTRGTRRSASSSPKATEKQHNGTATHLDARDSGNPAVERFREFLRFRTISGEGARGAYREACDWLVAQAKDIGLDYNVIEPVKGKPIVIMTITGTDESLPCVILNSHYDVVPCMMEKWHVEPFAGVVGQNGEIYGRGAQDMKCVCIQYLEALRALKQQGFKPLRTLHLTYVPDEEIGGVDGIAKLLRHKAWEEMQPVGLVLDEGLANENDAFTVFYGERMPWWVIVKAEGPTGHGSRFIKDTAASKLIKVANEALAFRDDQEQQLGMHGGCKHGQAKKLGDVTTLNLTMMRAGVTTDGGKTYSLNVIPTDVEAGFDIRISPNMPVSSVSDMIDSWCKKAGEGVSWEHASWTDPLDVHYVTSCDSDKNPWAGVFFSTLEKSGYKVETEVFPAATDSRFVRQLGLPAFGFSPMRNCPILLHEHNEYIPTDTFIEGIGVYEKLIPVLANSTRFDKEGENGEGKNEAKRARLSE